MSAESVEPSEEQAEAQPRKAAPRRGEPAARRDQRDGGQRRRQRDGGSVTGGSDGFPLRQHARISRPPREGLSFRRWVTLHGGLRFANPPYGSGV
jgi:hypothetical protein